eukprot:PLAT3423.1.p1 GENE.PLAT3423.1~~PLAT3423.1.p1  ORF type:complete len:368 (-),score=187.52 PLAT3423.1:134-1111(-)
MEEEATKDKAAGAAGGDGAGKKKKKRKRRRKRRKAEGDGDKDDGGAAAAGEEEAEAAEGEEAAPAVEDGSSDEKDADEPSELSEEEQRAEELCKKAIAVADVQAVKLVEIAKERVRVDISIKAKAKAAADAAASLADGVADGGAGADGEEGAAAAAAGEEAAVVPMDEEDAAAIAALDAEEESAKTEAVPHYEAALALLDEAIAAAPRYASAYNNRAQVLRLLERWDEALDSCHRAIALAKPIFLNDDAGEAAQRRAHTVLRQAYMQRAGLFARTGEEEEELADLERAAKLGSNFARMITSERNAFATLCHSAVTKMLESPEFAP